MHHAIPCQHDCLHDAGSCICNFWYQAGLISLLARISDGLVNKLQSVLRSAAHLVLRKQEFESISDDLREQLRWFPKECSTNSGLLVYKCLHGLVGLALSHLSDMLTIVSSNPYSCRLLQVIQLFPENIL